jgi:hypothetical protein
MVDALPTSLVVHRIASAVAGLALAFGSLWLCLRNLGQAGMKDWIFWVPLALLLVTISVLCWWFALRGQRPESRAAIHHTWRGGWLVGGVGFAAGFIGPHEASLKTPQAAGGWLWEGLRVELAGPTGGLVASHFTSCFCRETPTRNRDPRPPRGSGQNAHPAATPF